jgi:hypothetical protein
MKAIVYVRWSSDDQTAGNSLERQTANAQAYCDRAGLVMSSPLLESIPTEQMRQNVAIIVWQIREALGKDSARAKDIAQGA